MSVDVYVDFGRENGFEERGGIKGRGKEERDRFILGRIGKGGFMD